MTSRAITRGLGLAAAAGAALALSLLLLMPVVDPAHPVAGAYVSDYVHGPAAPLLAAFFGAWTVTAGALALGLHRGVAASNPWATAALAAYGVGMAVAGAFPSDGPGVPTGSTASTLHQAGALLIFAAGPIALALWSRAFAHDPAWSRVARASAVVAALAGVLSVGTYTVLPVGLGQRAFAATLVAWFVGIGVLLARGRAGV